MMSEKQFKELFLSEYDKMYRAAYMLLGDEEEAKEGIHVSRQQLHGKRPHREVVLEGKPECHTF